MAATTQMPMPTDPVTNERLESVLLGIATQIASAVEGAKSDMSGLVTEAELLWQTQLSELAEAQTGARASDTAPSDGLEAVRAQLAESETRTSELLRAQNAELAQLQEGLGELERNARRATTTRPNSSSNEQRSCLTR